MTPETRPYGQITFTEKLSLYGKLAKVLAVALYSAVTGLFRGTGGAPTYTKHIAFSAIRTLLNSLTFHQDQYFALTTEQLYLNFAKQLDYEPDAFAVTDECKALWVGDRNASKVFLYYHGGGYINSMVDAHIMYIADLVHRMKAKGHDFAVCILDYTLFLQSPWPKQLQQAAESLNILIERYDKKPDNIFIGGDSAGGNLALALCSHILHPRENVPAVHISAPLAGLVLISPWASFDVTTPSFRRNAETDYMHPYFLKLTSDAFTEPGGGSEWYNEPANADVEWWKGLDQVVKAVVIWGGGGEILLDGIKEIAPKITKAHPQTTTLISPGSCHIEPVLDYVFKTEPTKETKELVAWIEARL